MPSIYGLIQFSLRNVGPRERMPVASICRWQEMDSVFRLSIDFFPSSIASMSKVNEYSLLKAIGYIQANNTLIFSLNLIFYPSRECRLILLIDKIESKATEHGINMHLINKTQNFLLILLPAIHLLNLASLCSPVRCKKK